MSGNFSYTKPKINFNKTVQIMKNKYSLLILLCCILNWGSIKVMNAQGMERSVIASTGENLSRLGYSLDFTVGEPVSGTLINGEELTQGFQQEWLVVTAVVDPKSDLLEVSVYPNPTIGKVSIETAEQLEVRLFDALGNALQTETLGPGKNEMNMSQFPVGFYILVLQNKEGKKASTFKLQKTE
jgi:hypothetical protein